jgi:N-acetylglucosamine transport system permease protein
MRHGRVPFIVGFLIAPVTIYVVFVIWPYAQTFYLSMTNWTGYQTQDWIGFGNYRRMFNSDVFWDAVKHHAIILVTLPLVTIIIALFFSYLLNIAGRSGRGGGLTGVWGSKFYRVVFFFPQLLALPIIGVLFTTVYRPNSSGLIDGVLIKLGAQPIGWLTNQSLALWSVIAVLVWQAVGFYVVLFSAGMASIPKDILEAAEIDGATHGTLFFRVTLPLLWDTLQVAWVYLGIAAFDAFAIVDVLTVEQGGPDHSTTVLAEEIYRNAFQNGRPAYASAMGVALFFLTITFAALTLRVTRRETVEL